MSFFEISALVGGIVIFLHGLTMTREGLQLIASEKLRTIIFTLSKNRVVALLSGTFLSSILQSSTAATLMVVGFTASSLMTLTQAMAVLLGADIGTTITVQLISFHLPAYALFVVSIGGAIQMLAKSRRIKYFGRTVLGFGLLFLGMKIMEDSTGPLRASPGFHAALEYLSRSPAESILGAIALTLFMQGSAPTIGLLLAISANSSITLAVAMPIILGANIGTTITPVFMTANSNTEGRRVAMAHAVFKIAGALLLYPFLNYFIGGVLWLDPRTTRAIANAHTLFNALNGILFLPLIGLGAKLIRKHYTPGDEEKFGPRYLDLKALSTPSLAFGNAQREFLRMADMANDIVKDVLPAMSRNDLDEIANLEERDDKIDILNREIRFYLAKISLEAVSREQAERQVELISLANDIENVADLVTRDILPLALKKISAGLSFSAPGWAEIQDFHGKVCENFDLALVAYSSRNEEIARKVLRHRTHLLTIETQLKEKHISRLNQGTRESIETSSMHLDLLAQLRQINGYIGNLADSVLRSFEAEKQNQANN